MKRGFMEWGSLQLYNIHFSILMKVLAISIQQLIITKINTLQKIQHVEKFQPSGFLIIFTGPSTLGFQALLPNRLPLLSTEAWFVVLRYSCLLIMEASSFSQISWHMPRFPICKANVKTENRYWYHVFANNCASSWATSSQKTRSFGLFAKDFFWKKNNLWVFFIFDPIYLRTETEYRIHGFVKCKHFKGYINNGVKIDSFLVFFGLKKRLKKVWFFSFVAHLSKNWQKIQKLARIQANLCINKVFVIECLRENRREKVTLTKSWGQKGGKC